MQSLCSKASLSHEEKEVERGKKLNLAAKIKPIACNKVAHWLEHGLQGS